MSLPTTPSQTVGPYLAIGLHWDDGPFVVPEDAPGAFEISGRVIDGAGQVVTDALVETWQADPSGRFSHRDDPRGAVDGWRGFGRSETVTGEWRIVTVKPGQVPDGAGGLQAPHLDVSVFARGLVHRLVTRIYFADEIDANASDAVLLGLPDDAARATLLAQPHEGGYRLDIVLQGGDETVFFDV
jgi:protocatechuate 3,4-dioxygenase alpha subunit